jgi:hypothetical protein
MPCHRPMLVTSMCRLFKTQTGWRAPSMGVAGDVFGEEQAAQTSHQRRTSSRLCSPCSRPSRRLSEPPGAPFFGIITIPIFI